MSVLMIIVDGVGICPYKGLPLDITEGQQGRSGSLQSLPEGGWMTPTKADLDMPGLPQSATGHTTILTGVNAARYLGRHFPGYPLTTLIGLIEADNILKRAAERGLSISYANAFVMGPLLRSRRRLRSACTVAAQALGIPLKGLEELREGHALYHDFTNEVLIERGIPVSRLSPEEAGGRLAQMAERNRLTVYEYFLTDLAGHSQNRHWVSSEMERLRRFLLKGVIPQADLTRMNLIVCSDHGNVEDISTPTHTRNPVPTMIWGPEARGLAEMTSSIEDIASVVGRVLWENAPPPRRGVIG